MRSKIAEKQYRINKAIAYGYRPDGTYGADLKTLCELSYNYVGNGDTCIMVRIDDNVSHYLTTKNAFVPPKPHTRGKSLKIDPNFPGANIYILPQIMKRTYVSNEAYFSMPKSERYKYRTKRCNFQNDWKRKKLRSEMIAEKKKFLYWANHTLYNPSVPKEEFKKTVDEQILIIKKYYKDRIEATREGDVASPFVGKVGYSADDILAYRAIVLDFDGHFCPDQYGNIQEMPPELAQQLSDIFAKILIKGCDENGELIAPILPNFIVKTGRGLQLWFTFSPVMFPAVGMVKSVAEALCDVYKKVGEKYAPDLELDRASSLNLSGFKRLPGTYNSVAKYKVTKQKGKGKDNQTIEDMMSALGIRVYTKEEREIYKVKHKAKHKSFKAVIAETKKADNPALKKRAEKLLNLFYDEALGRPESDRNCFLFAAGAVANEAGIDISTYLKELNGRFAEHLSAREVSKIARSAAKGDYHFRTASIAQNFGISEEKLKEYGLSLKGAWVSNEERTKARKEKRDKRDTKIINLLFTGKKVSEVARKVGVCRKTVRDIRQRFEEKTALLKKRADKCRDNFLSLFTPVIKGQYFCEDRDRAYALQSIRLTS